MIRSNDDLSIRLATVDDLDTVVSLLNDCVAAMRAEGIEQWDEVYPNRTVLLDDIRAETMHAAFSRTGELAAIVVLNEYQNAEYASVPWTIEGVRVAVVHRLMVSPSWQGQGVARSLMRFAEIQARDNGYDAMRLDAFTANPRALRLYLGLGYRDAGGVAFRKGPFRCFEKKLDA